MAILYLIFPVIIIMALLGVVCLVWAVKNGQFEDMEGPKYRIFFDDDEGEYNADYGDDDR